MNDHKSNKMQEKNKKQSHEINYKQQYAMRTNNSKCCTPYFISSKEIYGIHQKKENGKPIE